MTQIWQKLRQTKLRIGMVLQMWFSVFAILGIISNCCYIFYIIGGGSKNQCSMRHAATASAIAWQSIFGCFVLVPRTHTSEDLKRQKDTLHLSQPNTLEYVSLRFSLIKLAKRLKNTVASPAMPQLFVVKSYGVKHPRSMSLTLCPYSLRFLVSCCLYTEDNFDWR